LGSAYAKIDPNKMAMQDMVRYKARDGLEIPAYLSLPQVADKKNLPMVVLVHGGPYVRGNSWGWNPEVQFLASRGYAVLQPEFRGSTGFGFKHFKAGWKQWGLAMQDDIADGVKWAIAQGIADPKRICIAGASYGGYATLMGLAKNPELFQCGVEWAGVTDIRYLYRNSVTSDFPAEYQQYGLPVLVGDKEKDAEQLRANSPTELTDKIKQPLLMAYGGADRRVPIEHGEVFYNKIKKTNDKVIWIRYDDEGHGWGLPKNRLDFWNKVDEFLQKNIGPQQ
jgi:dipeptidyl aminopeptidase/acylaminoacyl peptidase